MLRLLFSIAFAFQLLLSFAQDSLVVTQDPYKRVGAPVMVGEDTIFYIHSDIGPLLTAEKRAEHLQGYLDKFVKYHDFNFDTLFVESDSATHETYIDYGNERILIVTDKDALLDNTTRDALALAHLDAIKTAHKNYWNREHWLQVIYGLVYGVLLIVGLVFMIRVTNKLFRKLNKTIPVFITRKITHGIKIKDLEKAK